MPCFSTISVSHAVEKWDEQRAIEAIKDAGLALSVRYDKGNLVSTSRSTQQGEANINRVKQSYAKLTLLAAQKKFGWTVKSQTVTKTGLIQIGLTRR